MADINLVKPQAGQRVEIPAAADARFLVGFPTGEPVTTREGDALVFTFPDGGTIVVNNFYAEYTSASMPEFIIDGQTLPGEQFFAALGDSTLMPAAGPAAAAAAAGRGGHFTDYDNADFMGGIGRLGGLDLGWDENVETEEQLWGTPDEQPGGTFGLDVDSDLGDAMFAAGIFEDGQPYQHLGDYSLTPGQIHFNFVPSGSTVVDGIHLSGFTPGSLLFIGEPVADGLGGYTNAIEINSADQVVDFTQGNFSGPGVFILPPANSDADMDINAIVDLRAESSGITGTRAGSFTIIVDAVADKPMDLDASGAIELSGHVDFTESSTAEQKFADGFAKDTLQVDGKTDPAGLTLEVTVNVKATFFDFIDSSERHYALVEDPAAKTPGEHDTWTCALPDGTVLGAADKVLIWCDQNGSPLENQSPTLTDIADQGLQQVSFFKIPADGLLDADGRLDVNVTFTGTNTTITQDTDINLWTGAMAQEEQISGQELSLDNNVSYTFNDQSGSAHFTVDTITSTLNVTAGWASEGNDPAKHTDGGYTPNFADMADPADGTADSAMPGVAAASTSANGAPVHLEISGGNGERIEAVTFDYDSARGQLYYGNTAVNSGEAFTLPSTATAADFVFKPVDNANDPNYFNDADVTLTYKVTIGNATDAKGIYNGSTIIAVDAVADLARDLAGKYDYNANGHDLHAFAPGATVALTLTANFPDKDGSEDHYMLVLKADVAPLADQPGAGAGWESYGQNGEYWKISVGTGGTGSVTVNAVTQQTTGQQSVHYGALAVESDLHGHEYDALNNVALATNTVTFQVDAVDTTFDASKNVAVTNIHEDLAPGQNVGDFTQSEQPGGVVEFKVPFADGFDGDGDSVTGNETAVVKLTGLTGDGTWSWIKIDAAASDLAAPAAGSEFDPTKYKLVYVPKGNSDMDGTVDYTITVRDADSDASKTFTGSNTVIVDAVADKPTSLVMGAPDYNGDQTAAKPGEAVTFTASGTFSDNDGSEHHFLLVECPSTAWKQANPGLSTVTLNGKSYFYVEVTDQGADASTTFTLTTPSSGYTKDTPVTLVTKAVAIEVAEGEPAIKNGAFNYADGFTTSGPGQNELDTSNNIAVQDGAIKLDIKVVTSAPTVTIGKSPIFENLLPNAHEVDSVSGTNKVSGKDNVGATITVGGLAAGEAAAVTFTFSAKNIDNSPVDFTSATGHENDVMRLELVNGSGVVLNTYEVRNENGVWTAGTGTGAAWTPGIAITDAMRAANGVNTSDVVFTFKPGYNYNSSDIKVDYDIKVIDTASLAEKAWSTATGAPNKLNPVEIDVDAVAQLPTIAPLDGNVGQLNDSTPDPTDHYSHAAPGKDASLRTTVTFEDYKDGSEQHFVLVQYEAGCVPHTVIIGGQSFSTAGADKQNIDGNLYYKIPVANSLIAAQTTPGTLSVEVLVKVTSDMNGTELRVGALAHETALPGAQADTESEQGNNTSIVISNAVTIHVSGADGVSLDAGWIYDNDRPNAYMDNTALSHGTVITIGLGANDVVDSMVFADPTAGGKGTLYYMPVEKTGINWDDLSSYKVGSTAVLPKDGYELRFIPNHGTNNATDFNDADPKLSYTINVHDTLSGDKGTPSGTLTIRADAVAQMPHNVDAPADSVGTNVKHGETVSFVVNASFQDLDGSERHYILVEAHPNTAIASGVNYKVDGTYTHTNSDGTSVTYHKLLVDDTYLKKDGINGNASIEVKYVTSGLDTPGDGTVKVGALSYEPSGIENSNTEVTLHNNESFADGGSIGINFGPTGPGLWVGPVYENNTPNAHVGDDAPEYGKIHMNAPATAGYVEIKLPAGITLVHADGTSYTADASGVYRVDKSDFDDLCVKMPVNFSDKDLSTGLQYEYFEHGSAGSSWTIKGNPSWLVLDLDDAPGTAAPTLGGGLTGFWATLDGGNKVYVIDSGNLKFSEVLGNPAYFQLPGGLDEVKYVFHSGSSWPSNIQTGQWKTWDSTPTSLGGKGVADIIVDAVAQQPSGLEAMAHVDGILGEQHTVTISVAATFKDGTDSNISDTNHYVLVEALPGFAVEGATTVFVNGLAYFRVDVTGQTPGADGYQVTLKLTNPTMGDQFVKFRTGAMSMETGTDHDNNVLIGGADNSGDLEWRTDNNIAFMLNDKPCTVEVSLVNSAPSISVNPVYEHGDGDTATSGVINIGGMEGGRAADAPGAQDHLTLLTLKVENGALQYNGVAITSGVSADGKLNFAIGGDGTVTVTSVDPTASIPTTGFSYKSTSYDSTDVKLTWTATVVDPDSGDVKSFGGTPTIVVDAVAQAPAQHLDDVAYGGSHTAAEAGGKAAVTTTLTFSDSAGNEDHYAVLAHNNNWVCTGVTIDGVTYGVQTVYSKDGQPFYGYKIPNSLLAADGSVEVSFNVTAPKATTDQSYNLRVGGISFEADNGVGDKEITLSNNWQETLETVTLQIGVVETTKVTAAQASPVAENQPGDTHSTAITLGLTNGTNEVITKLTIAAPTTQGKLYYDGTEVPVVNGKAVITVAAGIDTSKLVFQPANYWSGTCTLVYTAEVTDTASGAHKDFPNGTVTLSVAGVASTPTNVALSSGAFTADHGAYTVDVTAKFPDTAGENHYILVAAVAGLTLQGSSTLVDGSMYGLSGNYYRVDVGGATENYAGTLTFTATPDYVGGGQIDAHALSTENSSYATAHAATTLPAPAADGFEFYTVHGSYANDAAHPLTDVEIHGSVGTDNITVHGFGNTIYGGDGSDTIHADGFDPITHAGNIIHGGEGNDMLFGGAGDDTLYGGNGNDYLYGGAGHNQLYGGEGHDILVFSADNTKMDGGAGIDFLVGADANSLDTLLGNGTITNVEVMVTQAPDSLSLTNLAAFGSLGVTVNSVGGEDKLHLDNTWTAGADQTGHLTGYTEYHHGSGADEITLLVQKTMLEIS